jgi:hypothetical protein
MKLRMLIVQARATLVCAIAMVLPATVYANDVSLPEIGVTLTGLADNADKPQVTERPAGYAAMLKVSPSTYVSLYRADDPIPSGNIDEATYRSDLLARLDDRKSITAKGAVTLVAGHEAWTMVGAQRLGPLISYTYTAYLIVDQHPYRLTVMSLGSQRPAEFDATVKAISSSIKFEPIQRSAESHPASVPGAMPRFVSGGHADYYPASSKGRDEQGIVDLEFNIDGQGHVFEVKQTFAVSRGLGDSAASQLRDGIFRVPADWVQTGSDKLRFAIEYQFKLLGHGSQCPAPEDAPRITGAKVVAICSALLGR